MKCRIYICIVLLATYFTSCTKPDINFGESYLDNSFTNIVSVDTATPVISTVYIDSFVSSGTGKAVIGKYIDPVFGTVTAQSYFSVIPPAFSDIYSNSIYDSLELILKPDKSYYGDTTQLLQLNVNQLSQNIVYGENTSSLFNTSSFPVNATVLGSVSLHVRPSGTDTISIRLSDLKGMELLNKLRNADADITTSANFIEYFKGLRVSAGSSPAFMLGFSDSIIMRLHYRDPGIFMTSKTVDFTLSDNTLQFNEIHADRTATALSAINPANTEIPSANSNNSSYLQSATGTEIKVRFPYIRDFLTNSQFVKIVKAQLIVKPLSNSFSGYYLMPPQIRLSQTTQLNELGADITDPSTSSVEYGDLSIDNLYGENTEYVYDVTSYIIAQMAIEENNENALLLSPPAYTNVTNFNRLIVGDKVKTSAGIQLKLYYISVAK